MSFRSVSPSSFLLRPVPSFGSHGRTYARGSGHGRGASGRHRSSHGSVVHFCGAAGARHGPWLRRIAFPFSASPSIPVHPHRSNGSGHGLERESFPFPPPLSGPFRVPFHPRGGKGKRKGGPTGRGGIECIATTRGGFPPMGRVDPRRTILDPAPPPAPIAMTNPKGGGPKGEGPPECLWDRERERQRER